MIAKRFAMPASRSSASRPPPPSDRTIVAWANRERARLASGTGQTAVSDGGATPL